MSAMERPQMRTRPKSGFSFKSDKSQSSRQSNKQFNNNIGDSPKASPDGKRKSSFTTTAKSNPNAAMNEAQPVATQLEDATIGDLRSMQHTDNNGNIIVEPDLSNPTRSRWERPLDTIRSFEAAIETEYRRRASMMRFESAPDGLASGYASRRSSYYGGHDYHHNQRASQIGGYYGNRQSYYENGPGQQQNYGPRSRLSQKLPSDPYLNRQGNGQIYPIPQYHQSRDTVNTGGSGSQSEPLGPSTDPSSENSSIERHTPNIKFDNGDWNNNYSGAGGPVQPNARIPEERFNSAGPSYRGANSAGFNQNGGYFPQQQQYGAPPPPPKHAAFPQTQQPRGQNKIIRLSTAGQPQSQLSQQPQSKGSPPGEKRKSWFKRRFSKD